jgi:hypothetical protein
MSELDSEGDVIESKEQILKKGETAVMINLDELMMQY